MKSFQSFSTPIILDEASTLASTDAEQFIADLWNIFSKKPTFEQFKKGKSASHKSVKTYHSRYGGGKGLPKDWKDAVVVIYDFGQLSGYKVLL